jgi:hypothetical protein
VGDQQGHAADGASGADGGVGVPLVEQVLGAGVQGRGRLVEDEQQRGLAHERSRDGEGLPLSEGQFHAAERGAELGVEVLGQGAGRVEPSGAGERSAHRDVVVEQRQVADADVLAEAYQQSREVLVGGAEPGPPGSPVHTVQRLAVDCDGAAVRLVQPAQQLDKRGFAGAVQSDQCYRRTRRYPQ